MKRMGWTILLAAALLVTAAGCGDDDSTGPGNGGVFAGELSFDYSGAISGAFEARGGWSQSGGWDDAFAVAMVNEDMNYMGVSAFTPTSAATGNMVVLLIEGAREPGTYRVEEDCDGDCVSMLFYFGVSSDHATLPSTRIFVGLEGQIVATRVGRELAGTFSAEAFELLSEEEGELTVSGGSFEAPVVDVEIPSPGGPFASMYAVVADHARRDGLDALSPRMRAIALDFLDRLAGRQGR
ncbi:MAG TPA: hypothetical protein VIL18_06425 [Longimicrobiales bacterium]